MSEPTRTSTNEARLRPELGTWLATAVTVNAMVGTGIFRLAPDVLRATGSAALAATAWTLGGAIAFCGALCVSELAAALPRAGGIYEYLRRAYGPACGFWFGWTRLWLLGPSAAGSFARLAAESLGAWLGLAPAANRDTAVAMLILVLCTVANLTRVRTASTGQALLSALKLAGLLLLGLTCLGFDPSAGGAARAHPAPSQLAGIMPALISVMWAYDGWADMSALAAEAKHPQRVLPRALLLGTLVVSGAYALANLGYVHVLGEAGVMSATSGSDMVAMRAAERVSGELGRRALSALVFASSIGGCLVGMLTGSRVFVAMASDGLFFPWLGHVSPRTGTPARAVLLGTTLGLGYLSVRSFEQLTDAFVIGMFPFYALAVIAVAILRRREPALPRPFVAPLYPLVALIFLAGAAALLTGALSQLDRGNLAALAVMAIGLPLGLLFTRRS